MDPKRIMVALTAGDSPALGNIWRITAKRTDFYLDPHGETGTFHLTVHGPNELFEGHRFHVKLDRRMAAAAQDRGLFVEHSVPRNGYAFDGERLAHRAFLVARIRWTWDLQRDRFRRAAASGQAPELADHESGARLSALLSPNDAWDLDLIVSYDEPYWPNSVGSLRDNARLGPLSNDAGLWLTATSYHRSQKMHPTPEGLILPLPTPSEEPNRIMSGGPGPGGPAGIYWFVEAITKRELLQATRQ